MGPRGARRAAGCLLLCWALAAARAGPRRRPSFSGHVAENRPAGTRVRGLSIPLTRLGPEPWCAKVQGRRWRLQLLGEGHSHFQVSLHARTARVWLRTSRPLDREARALYSFRLGLCCKRCRPRGAAAAELAALTVRVLDDNDNAPRFVGGPRPGVRQLRVEETLALRSQVWQARAEDADAGANAELRYFALPRSAHFFVVPRSGRVVLVRSLLHLRAPIPLRLYARDRGRPALLSDPLELEVLPQPRRLPPLRAAARRRRRSAPPPAAPLALSPPEDARAGSRVAALAPARFASAWLELLSPPVAESPVRVEREAAAAWELVVRVPERRALFSAVFSWARWKARKALNGGVYHVSVHHEDLEDIRESIYNYNEEGGGEQDQDAYNMAELQVSIQTSPAYSLCKKKEDPTKLNSFSDASPSTQEQTKPSVATAASFTSGDLGQYLSDIVRDADCHPRAVPQGSLQVFCTEGEGSVASSLSTLSSSGLDEGTVYDGIREWGPKFEKLSELYSHTDAEDL